MNRLKFRIISCALIVLLTMGIIPGSLWTAMGEEEIVNLAYQKTATATFTELTASVGTVDPLNVADGDVSTRWSSFGISEDMIPAIMIDLDAVVTLSEVDILLYADEREYEFELYLTNEPIVFEGFADLDGREPIYSGAGIGSGSVPNLVPTDMSGCTVVEIDSTVEGRYLTYVGTYVSGGAHAIWELEAYGEVKQIIVHDIVSINAFKASEILVTEDISSCLPSMATVSLDNNKSTEVPIIWNLDGYTAGVAGEYTINGTLDLSELPGVSNTQELQATMTVLVIDPSEKVREVENLIAAIGELTEENYVQCLPAIQAAEQALQELISSYGEELAADVSNQDVLKTARAEYERLYNQALEREKEAAIQAVEELIAAIDKVTAENYTEKLAPIEAAETALDQLKADYDEATADRVSNKADLEQARASYDEYSRVTYGDINMDDKIDAQDALLALQHSVQIKTLDEGMIRVADVNDDGDVNATDALLILQHSVHIISQFPVEQQK